MDRWPHKVDQYTMEEVGWYCVRDSNWQEFRKGLKGLPTQDKLKRLDFWLSYYPTRNGKVQVDNYINALKRGGQLGMDLTVKR